MHGFTEVFLEVLTNVYRKTEACESANWYQPVEPLATGPAELDS